MKKLEDAERERERDLLVLDLDINLLFCWFRRSRPLWFIRSRDRGYRTHHSWDKQKAKYALRSSLRDFWGFWVSKERERELEKKGEKQMKVNTFEPLKDNPCLRQLLVRLLFLLSKFPVLPLFLCVVVAFELSHHSITHLITHPNSQQNAETCTTQKKMLY